MSDFSDIRERVDAATPGPWRGNDWPHERDVYDDGSSWGTGSVYPAGPSGPPPVAIIRGIDSKDIDLIAHAPEDIRRLLDTIDQINAVLADEPDPCPEHCDADPITCGWKRDIVCIRQILNEKD